MIDCNKIYVYIFRLTPTYVPSKLDYRLTETEAGRRFLEALRLHHENDEKVYASEKPNVQNVQAASFGFGSTPVKSSSASELKRKRMSLRVSLEELLVEYLRGLAPETDDYSQHSRIKRSDNTNNNFNGVEKIEKSVENYPNDVNVHEKNNLNAEIVESNENSTCIERRQRITQLDRNELDAALRNDSYNEYNIRRLLNHR